MASATSNRLSAKLAEWAAEEGITPASEPFSEFRWACIHLGLWLASIAVAVGPLVASSIAIVFAAGLEPQYAILTSIALCPLTIILALKCRNIGHNRILQKIKPYALSSCPAFVTFFLLESRHDFDKPLFPDALRLHFTRVLIEVERGYKLNSPYEMTTFRNALTSYSRTYSSLMSSDFLTELHKRFGDNKVEL